MMRRNGKTIRLMVISIVNAIVLLLVCYFTDNWGFSVLTGPSIGQRIELAKGILGSDTDRVPDDYVFINTSYDKELVPVYDQFDLPEGEMDITHRGRLATFLSRLEDAHKFVMLDVLLSDRFHSDSDSLLTATILNTDRIGIASSVTTSLPDERLSQKAGLTDYSVEIYETNFVKYEFIQNGEKTLPYYVYLLEHPDDKISSFGPFYFRNGALAWKSLTLRFPIKLWNETIFQEDGSEEDDGMQEKIILNLGSDVLDTDMDIPALVKDKTVVIGDFREDDIHDTYLGKIAGPVININALEALRNDQLTIPWWLIIFLLILYSAVTYLSLDNSFFKKFIGNWMNKVVKKSQLLKSLLTFIGYSFVFSIFATIIYLSAGLDINILIPSLWFTMLGAITKYRRMVKGSGTD